MTNAMVIKVNTTTSMARDDDDDHDYDLRRCQHNPAQPDRSVWVGPRRGRGATGNSGSISRTQGDEIEIHRKTTTQKSQEDRGMSWESKKHTII